MGQKGEPGAPGPGISRGIIYGDTLMTAPPSGDTRPGEVTHHDYPLVLVVFAERNCSALVPCLVTTEKKKCTSGFC
jgi:hypothetical protein